MVLPYRAENFLRPAVSTRKAPVRRIALLSFTTCCAFVALYCMQLNGRKDQPIASSSKKGILRGKQELNANGKDEKLGKCSLEGSTIPPAETIIIDFDKINGLAKDSLERVKDYTAEDYAGFLLSPPGREHYTLLNYIAATYGDCRHLSDIGTRVVASALAMASNKKTPVWTFDLPGSTERTAAFRGNTEGDWQKQVQGLGVDITFYNLDLMKASDGELKKYLGTWFIFLDTYHLPDTVPFEREFFQRMIDIGFKGILGLDDIHLNDQMEKWWKEVQDNAEGGGYTTFDLTKVGHWSGTGLVDFSGRVMIKQ